MKRFIILTLLLVAFIISTAQTTKEDVVAITVNGVSFNMHLVEGGTFTMGSDDDDCNQDQKPLHSVTLSDYYIGETEVTQALWMAIMEQNPSAWVDDSFPVQCVTWELCKDFARKLSRLTGRKFDLPTEAQWEFAAKGGNKSKGYIYAGSYDPQEVVVYYKRPSAVGEKKANELGLYDMSGNVWEWCLDYYGPYPSSHQTNPKGPEESGQWVMRGGSYNIYTYQYQCKTTYRASGSGWSDNCGFRLVMLP